MESIGERLDWIRDQKKMSLEDFGQYFGYGQEKTTARQVMSRIFSNHRNLTLEDLIKLQSVGVDLNWLINGVGEIKELGEESQEKFATYHFYDGAEHVETLKIPEFKYPEIINMQSDEIFAVGIKTDMMSPTINQRDRICSQGGFNKTR